MAAKEQVIQDLDRVISLIKTDRKDLSAETKKQMVMETLDYFDNYVSPGWLKYRKSVSSDSEAGAVLEWDDEGAYIYGLNGEKFIDCLGGFGIYTCGHRNPEIMDVVRAQLDHQALHSQELLDPLRGYLAKAMSDITPGDLQQCFFTNGGAEAVEMALKLARIATGGRWYISTVGAFHGKSMGAISMGGKGSYRVPYTPMVQQVQHVEYGCAEDVRKAIRNLQIVGEKVAAVILEPIQGEAGVIIPPKGYLAEVRKICDETGVALIFDEIQTGMGRTGTMWRCEAEGVCPDIMTFGKAFGGGILPITGIICKPSMWTKDLIDNPWLLGSVIGAIFLYGKDFMTEWVAVLQSVVADNAWLWLVCGLFGSLIAVLTASKGTFGFARIIGKVCDTQRKSLFATYIMGILIFIDDYLNVLSIGTCMKSLFDKRKMPREALAFLLDSTGAPVCVLIPFSTWAVFYSELFIEQEAISAEYSSGLSAYIAAIPFCFYPICALIVVALFCTGIFPKLGHMKAAYRRVEETGMVYSARSRKFNLEEGSYDEDGNIWNFLVPMIVMVIVSFITNEILIGVITGLIICLIMYVPTKIMNLEKFMSLTVSGFGTMLSIFFLLTGCFTLQVITAEMGMTEYIIERVEPYLTPAIFPAVCFLLLGGLAFITASDWGMSAVVIPIFIPLAAVLGASIPLTMAAIISGGTFGSHACFYADATVLSSQSSGIDNMDHALSQLPYVGFSAGVAIVCFLAAGFALR